VASLGEIPERRSKRCVVDGAEIALWRVSGRIYAVDNVCAHQHMPVLHQGLLDGLLLSCPMHGWTYSLETGKATTGNGRVRAYDVVIDGNDVYVQVPESRS
jgi:nitrite reductase (NADH) small subunit